MKLKLTVDGKVYEVDVEVAQPEPPQPSYVPPGGRVGPAAPPSGERPSGVPPPVRIDSREQVVDESKVCRSPIAGVVVRVAAQVGQRIQANDVLMVLEAMKMATEITSPVAGQIVKVNAQANDPVQAGQVLIEFA